MILLWVYSVATVYIINNMFINILQRTYTWIFTRFEEKKNSFYNFFSATLDHVACVHIIDRNEFFLHTNRQKKICSEPELFIILCTCKI